MKKSADNKAARYREAADHKPTLAEAVRALLLNLRAKGEVCDGEVELQMALNRHDAARPTQTWCPHKGGLGPPFPFCEVCAKGESPTPKPDALSELLALRDSIREVPTPLVNEEVDNRMRAQRACIRERNRIMRLFDKSIAAIESKGTPSDEPRFVPGPEQSGAEKGSAGGASALESQGESFDGRSAGSHPETPGSNPGTLTAPPEADDEIEAWRVSVMEPNRHMKECYLLTLNDIDEAVALMRRYRERAEMGEAKPCVQHCEAERAAGNDGCGACALCCKEQRERAEKAEWWAADLQEQRDKARQASADWMTMKDGMQRERDEALAVGPDLDEALARLRDLVRTVDVVIGSLRTHRPSPEAVADMLQASLTATLKLCRSLLAKHKERDNA